MPRSEDRRWWWWRRRITVCGKVCTTAAIADLVHDERDDETENDQRRPEDPDGLRDAASCNVDCIGCVQASEHFDDVSAYSDVFTEMGGAEEVDEVVADGCVVICPDTAEEDDHIVVGVVRDVHVAEEDHDVVIDVSFGIDATEEADGVVDGLTFGDNDVAAELNRVLAGVGGDCREEK